MQSSEKIRKQFIEFFESKEHKITKSSPVIPIDDPTLLFTNAGMNQFKNIFLGQKKPEYSRIVNSQKCIRAGGKHNDLEEVGRDGYHHTFFEMLGNWSFADYYKKEAIIWAWQLLTEVWKLPKDKLFATVHKSDKKSFELWENETDIDPKHIEYHGDKDNFWEMGEIGPCGPSSEIHIDRGLEFCNLKNEPKHKCSVNGDCHRYIELWNLVFIQYNRDEKGTLHKLSNTYVDTGAGFERICQVLQDKTSNYETDLFMPIIHEIINLSGKKYSTDEKGISHRVIADHIRALSFALADGGMPSNEGRGYVLRRILRRAARHGRLLELNKPFLYKLVDTVVKVMGEHYAELVEKKAHIKLIIKAEEERFNLTLDRGLEKIEEIGNTQTKVISNLFPDLEKAITKIQNRMKEIYPNNNMNRLSFSNETMKAMKKFQSSAIANKRLQGNVLNIQLMEVVKELQDRINNSDTIKAMKKLNDSVFNNSFKNFEKLNKSFKISGSKVFQLYDTFGFPPDLTRILAEEKGLTVDEEGFQKEMEKQKERARKAGKFNLDESLIEKLSVDNSVKTKFIGYKSDVTKAKIQKYFIDDKNNVILVLNKTPFYAESGGQKADIGKLYNDECEISIVDVQKENDIFFHFGKLISGEINHKLYTAVIDKKIRKSISRNHTASHLLHKALKDILGEHVNQKGSFVHQDHLRFDFTHFQQVTSRELQMIEKKVNEKVRECMQITTHIQNIEEAKKEGAIALFGEKYDDEVRVVTIGEFSKELCGGVHLKYTGEIGLFKITSESSIAAGIRRIEAITGEKSEQYVKILENEIDEIGSQLNAQPTSIIDKLGKIITENKEMHIKLKKIRVKSAGNTLDDLIKSAIIVNGINVVAAKINIQNPGMLRQIGDQLKNKLGSGIGVLAAENNGKVSLIAVVTKDLINKYKAGQIIGQVAKIVNGSGGGRPDMAMAGGKDINKIEEAIKKVPEIIEKLF